jgi:hypothetical protein
MFVLVVMIAAFIALGIAGHYFGVDSRDPDYGLTRRQEPDGRLEPGPGESPMIGRTAAAGVH